MKITLKLITLLLLINISFASVLFITESASIAAIYNGNSYIFGSYTGNFSGKYPATVETCYIAPNIKDVFNVANPALLKSFIYLSNGEKIFENPNDGPSLSKNLYNLINVGDTVYKVKWKRLPKISGNKIIFPRSFNLMSMVNFIKIINFPVYTEDLLKDYINSNGATVTVFESKPKFRLIINKSNYQDLPVSLSVFGNVEKVIWKINNQTFNSKFLTFVATRSDYTVKLNVTGDLGTEASTSIKMKFSKIMTYTYEKTPVKNTFNIKGKWYIPMFEKWYSVPFFKADDSATITYDGKLNFIGFEYENGETIVHEFSMKDKIPPKIIDNCNHKFYQSEPLKISFYFRDSSGVNYKILLNKKEVKNNTTIKLPYGKYSLTVTATDNFGNLSTYSTEITILDTIPPIARVDNYVVNEGEEFYLDGSKCSDNGTIVSYKWIIGDNIFYGRKVKTHIDKSGIYHGSLIVTDDSYNSSVANFTITVKDNVPPLLIFSSTTISASPGETLELHPFIASDDSGKVTIIWIMQNPKVYSIGKTFKYKFTKPGTYQINVVAQDPSHNQTMVQLSVVIK